MPTEQDGCLALSRGRRERKSKQNRFAALERLKKAKEGGNKDKWATNEDADNVYEEVDEAEYSRIVRERQEDDWIVDDDGSGYVEDGREIFDDEFHDPTADIGDTAKGGKKRKQNPNIRAPNSKPKSIKSMFAAAAIRSKPKLEKDVNLNDDDVLGDIMTELQQKPSPSILPPPVKLKKKPLTPKTVVNPFSAKAAVKKPNPVKSLAPTSAKPDREMAAAVDNDVIMDDESQEEAPKPPEKKGSSMKTALDRLQFESESPAIDEYDSEKQTAGVEENGMDVSGIDFDDDFSEEKPRPQNRARNFVTCVQDKENKQPDSSNLSGPWEIGGDSTTADIPVDIVVDSSKLPLTPTSEGEQVLRMFWLDAYEDHFKQPGTVYLFGKVWIESAKAHVSCCVTVKNIDRKVYILPRKTRVNPQTWEETGEAVTFVDMFEEFNTKVTEKYKILKFKSKKSTKEYAFEKEDVPVESEYLEVRYSAEYPQLPQDLRGETFSHVFGVNTPCLEILLIERKLKGPCWIDIKYPQIPSPPVSWCKVEAFVTRPDYISVVSSQPATPPMIVMTLNLKTVPNPKTHQNEVVAAAGLIHHKMYMDKPAPSPPFQQHFAAISKPNDCVFPYDFKEQVNKGSQSMKVEVMTSERALLAFLLAKIYKLDPDIIVGHDMFGFHMDVLLHRIGQNKIPHWSRLGRLKKANMPKLTGPHGAKSSAAASATSGRLVCDVQISARELIRCKSYDLTELTSQVLKDKRRDVDADEIRSRYNKSSLLLELLDLTLRDCNYILRLMYELMVIPLALQITNICGNVMARTLMGGRSERNEYLLLHAFSDKNFIVPDKYQNRKQVQAEVGGGDDDEDAENTSGGKKSGRRKPAYAGGLVLEPKKGFYDKYILLLDFNSLYPSIIQEYNICFTTINRSSKANQTGEEDEEMHVELPDESLEPGILPTEIRKLVQSRRQVKQLMKNPDLSKDIYMQYDIRQKALKLTANSMYGCLGFTFSRFYAKPLAALVTGKGREILMKTKDLVQSMNLDVIYGDTDSIMINTNSTDMDVVFKLGNKVKAEVNKLYKLLEIDIDGVFKSMLLLKKKKYAALNVTKVGDTYQTSQELKGLDIVRRDWCELAKQAGNFVVSEILSGTTRENIVENIHSELIRISTEANNGKVPLELFYITKQLTKNPEDYPDKRSLSHVQVALRLNSKGGRKMRAGDTVYYVICEDGSIQAASQRAYHPDEVLKSDSLKIDMKYYLAHQVHPVVARLCDPIDGTDAAHIAECLGLDPTGYRQAMRAAENEEDEALLGGAAISDEERYKDCERLKFACPSCQKDVILDAPFTGAGEYIEASLEKCPGCKCRLTEYRPLIMNRLTMCIRAHVNRYYQGWLCCEDSTCNARVKRAGLMFHRGHPVCHVCHRGLLHAQYSDSELYTQLCFYQYLFDMEKALKNLTDPREKEIAKKCAGDVREDYLRLKAHVDGRIKQSAYSEVNLTKLFHGLFSLK